MSVNSRDRDKSKVWQLFGVFHYGALRSVFHREEDAIDYLTALVDNENSKFIHIRPVFVSELNPEAFVLDNIIAKLELKLTNTQAEYLKLVEEERADIANAALTKASMPNNYWHKRHQAFIRVENLQRVLGSLSLLKASEEKFLEGG